MLKEMERLQPDLKAHFLARVPLRLRQMSNIVGKRNDKQCMMLTLYLQPKTLRKSSRMLLTARWCIQYVFINELLYDCRRIQLSSPHVLHLGVHTAHQVVIASSNATLIVALHS